MRGLLSLWLSLAALAWALPLALLPRSLTPAGAAPEGDAHRTVAYEIHATLDPLARRVTGRATLRWRNRTSVPAPDFHLHLYLNAFRDAHSTFLREAAGGRRGAGFDPRHPGAIDLTSFRTAAGEELVGRGAFVACDDGNPDDKTVWSVPLPVPVAPGEEAVFQLEWTSLLPKAVARTGFGGDYHMVAQWFPKPGVFESVPGGTGYVGRWSCHQHHGTSEFFADYGTYDVSITLPRLYEGRVGATGLRVAAHADEQAGTVTYRYVAHDVHDFAWVCDSDFVVTEFDFPRRFDLPEDERARVAAWLGRDPSALHLPQVKVTLLLQPEHLEQEERHARAVSHALAYMCLWFGAYPYPTLTVVDPDHRAPETGGMEYPTLITVGTGMVVPARGWDPELVVVHEFGHQFFYGLVGTNEAEHAWMDEGLTTFATARVLDRAYPPAPPVSWYGAWPLEGERPLAWHGLLQGLRTSVPYLPRVLDDHLRLPFGRLGLVRAIGEGLGLSPPTDLPLLPDLPDTGPLAFLREAPYLTLLPIRPIRVAESERTSVARRPPVDPIDGPRAWEYMDTGSYFASSYDRAAASLRTFGGLVGEEVLLRGLRTYVERHRYGHPTPEALLGALGEAAEATGQKDARQWLEVLFRSAGVLDYGVADIQVWEPDEARDREAERDGRPRRLPESTVLLRRHGEIQLPVEVAVRFDDGSERLLRWQTDGRVITLDGQEPPLQVLAPRGEQGRWTRLRYVAQARVVEAECDPRRLLALEHDRTNDGLSDRPARPGAALGLAVRTLGWVQQLTTWYGGL